MLGGKTKHLITGPTGNREFCFPSASMLPSALPQVTVRVLGKQNSLFPLGPVIKCLLRMAIQLSVIKNAEKGQSVVCLLFYRYSEAVRPNKFIIFLWQSATVSAVLLLTKLQ